MGARWVVCGTAWKEPMIYAEFEKKAEATRARNEMIDIMMNKARKADKRRYGVGWSGQYELYLLSEYRRRIVVLVERAGQLKYTQETRKIRPFKPGTDYGQYIKQDILETLEKVKQEALYGGN